MNANFNTDFSFNFPLFPNGEPTMSPNFNPDSLIAQSFTLFSPETATPDTDSTGDEECGLIFWLLQKDAKTTFERFQAQFQTFFAGSAGLKVESFGKTTGNEHRFFFVVFGPHRRMLPFTLELEKQFQTNAFAGGFFPDNNRMFGAGIRTRDMVGLVNHVAGQFEDRSLNMIHLRSDKSQDGRGCNMLIHFEVPEDKMSELPFLEQIFREMGDFTLEERFPVSFST